MRKPGTLRDALGIAVALLIPAMTNAEDGRIEINQASIEAGGGFPYTITEPGSYLLTGPLAVPAETSAIIIESDFVSIDLNGFRISGPYVCEGICAGGVGDGIANNGNFRFTTILNGQVSGFSDRCIQLFTHARVEHVRVHDCGRTGIDVSEHSSINFNQVFSVGDLGIMMAGEGSVLAHNTVSEASVSAGNHPAVQGGKETAGNFCDDGSCGSTAGRRRFYLTQDTHFGHEALTACASGFHMASLWEILDVTGLRYETDLGVTRDDSGLGPPADVYGWVRTGEVASIGTDTGRANCNNWTTGSGAANGTAMELWRIWNDPSVSISPWIGGALPCDTADSRVWCVED